MTDLTQIDEQTWSQMTIFAEHNELTMDYVLSEFYIDDEFIPVNY